MKLSHNPYIIHGYKENKFYEIVEKIDSFGNTYKLRQLISKARMKKLMKRGYTLRPK